MAGGDLPGLPGLVQRQRVLLGRGRARVRVDTGFQAEGSRDGDRETADSERRKDSGRGHAEGTHVCER